MISLTLTDATGVTVTIRFRLLLGEVAAASRDHNAPDQVYQTGQSFIEGLFPSRLPLRLAIYISAYPYTYDATQGLKVQRYTTSSRDERQNSVAKTFTKKELTNCLFRSTNHPRIKWVLEQSVHVFSSRPVSRVLFGSMELFKIQHRLIREIANGGVCKIQGGRKGPTRGT